MLRAPPLEQQPVSPTSAFVENQLPSHKLLLGGGSTSAIGSRSGGAPTLQPTGQGANVKTGSSAAVVSTATAAANSLKCANMVAPCGLTSDQTQRLQNAIASSGSLGVGPRLRAVELMHYWASSEATVKAIEAQVHEALRLAGISGDDKTYSPKAPASATKPSVRSPHTSTLKGSPDSVTAVSGVDEDAPMEQPPALQLAADAPREDFGTPALSVGDHGALALNLTGAGAEYMDSSPRRNPGTRLSRNNLVSHPKSPRTNGPSSVGSFGSLTPHYHIVDEVDAAHARGALSPRSVSPAMQLNQDLGCVPQSPMDLVDSAARRHSPSGMLDGSTNSVSTTPRRPGEDHNGRPSRSPSPAGSLKVSEELNSRNNSAVMPLKKAPPANEKPRYASYQDIPRFYFAEGKPQTQSTTLVGPHSNKHENPHLTIFEGVAVPVGAQAQLLLAQQQMAGGPVPDLSSLQPQGPKMSPMLPLAVMEDEDVLPFIQREFARLPAPPPKPQPQVHARPVKGGGSVLRRPTTSNAAPTKQEQAYRQALTSTMHRVCTQAFGLPRYLGQLVFRKLLADAESAADEFSSNALPGSGQLSRPGTSSGAANGAPFSAASTGTITVAQVKEFYEKHLRFKSIVRRMFEVLIATSKTPGGLQPGGALGGAMSGAAISVQPPPGSPILPGASGEPTKRNYLLRDDFNGYLDVLLESHPGLGFLRQTQDFQGKYVETVVIRIFYDLDRADRGRITWPEFENSKLPDAIRQVDATDDINTVLNYFSYEHFYVLYCRFWELDEDRDLLISQQDLQKYAPDGTMSPKLVERVFQGFGRKLTCKTRGKMNYEDFVWFCLSEEDKTSPKAIRYWFRILDLDGDGLLSGFELETFYAHTKKQLLQMTTEGISFSDVVCQVFDMLPFSLKQGIRLGDLLASPQAAHVALNMITNVVKFLQFEQRDPFVAHHDRLLGGFERNDWDRFARQEYDRMAQEADGEG